jgi:two-component system, chemotaxis family, chemotaxis protein CheY
MAGTKRILVVDDDAFSRKFLREVLSDYPHQIAEAKNGAEALERIGDFNPDLLLLDLLMPERSGLEVLMLVKRRHPDMAVLVISSLDTEHLIKTALKAGADSFISKPFDPSEVRTQIDEALR